MLVQLFALSSQSEFLNSASAFTWGEPMCPWRGAEGVLNFVEGWATVLRPGSVESGWTNLMHKENRRGETISHRGEREHRRGQRISEQEQPGFAGPGGTKRAGGRGPG